MMAKKQMKMKNLTQMSYDHNLRNAYEIAKGIAKNDALVEGVFGSASVATRHDEPLLTANGAFSTHFLNHSWYGKFISFKLKLTKSNSYNIKRN